jgi:hypothetical protein
MSLKAQNGKKTGDELGDGQKACKNYENREENVDLSATSKSTASMERTSCEQASKLRWISETERSQAKPRRIVAMENSFVGGDVRETASFFFSEATSVNLFTVLWRY